jgi:hypothetical protein
LKPISRDVAVRETIMNIRNSLGVVFLALTPLAAVACTSSSLTSPSEPTAASGTGGSVSVDKLSVQKVTLYFHDTDDGITSPPTNVVGMAIQIQPTIPASSVTYSAVTGKQGAATFWLPSSISQIQVTTGGCATHYNPTTHQIETETFDTETALINLPVNTREGWITVHETVPNEYGCTLP